MRCLLGWIGSEAVFDSDVKPLIVLAHKDRLGEFSEVGLGEFEFFGWEVSVWGFNLGVEKKGFISRINHVSERGAHRA